MDTEFALHPDTDVSWADEAICKGLTHVFFGPAAERPERRAEREAIAATYCMACPVMIACRTTARLNREHGFWGCENDEERALAGYAPRSPSRRAVIQARDRARQHYRGELPVELAS
ncbi:MAG: WhiB family transcriptional regulator [Actinomycetota bacterium]